ncbi:hypothetical protein ACEWY4_002395 [Coilia grayii]|uniref:Ig-like domain-containing protein n=1 Tax=Coilia grayii TaxID=363190 RepID=A0ABD1KN76_9TELE
MKEKKMVSIPCALILLLICPRPVHNIRDLYSRDGGTATLPCDRVRGPNCSSVSWNSSEWGIPRTKIWPDSPPDRAERLSLLPDCSLHITNVTTEDAGLYRCGNHQSGRSEDLHLHVLAGVLYFRDGGNATLPCDGVGGPHCSSVSWDSNEYGLFTDTEIWPRSPPDRAGRLSLLPDCSLHITNVTAKDARLYRCRNHQSGRSEDLLLHVLAARFVSPTGVLYSRDGGDATLPCDGVRGPHCSSVSWYSDEDGLWFFRKKIWPDSPPDRAERLSLLPDCSLHITNVTTEDAGLYRCGNHQSRRGEHLLLHVLAGVLYSRDGGDATLPCDGVGGPNCSSVSWYSVEDGGWTPGTKIWPDSPPDRAERLSLLPDCSLHITNVTSEDAGRYRCVLYSHDGGNATLPCDGVRGPNCSSVSWNSDEYGWGTFQKKIWPDSPPDRAERLSLLPDCSLHITNVTTEDAGRYRCKNHQSGRSEDLLLHVLAGVLYSHDGGDATLPCDGVRGPNCSSVSWYSDEDGLWFLPMKIWPDAPPDRAERLSLLPDCSLHITNVTTEDAGRYRCKNHQSGRSEGLLLHVLAVPSPSESDMEAGGHVTLPCVLHTGTDYDWLVHPDITVSWVEVGGADLWTSTHYQTTRSSAFNTTLTVSLTSPAPSSQWRCCVTARGQVQLSSVLYTFGHGVQAGMPGPGSGPC